jgi:thioredoxin-dependent peroxiredoxin
VAYFTASVDTPEVNKQFAESLELDYPVLSDPGKEVARAYGVVTGERALASRWTFYIGKDGKILHVDKSGATATQGQEVVDRLKALGITKRP